MSEPDDKPLQVLLEVRDDLGLDLSDDLIRRLYAIQRRFQYADDRAVSKGLMESCIEEHVNHVVGAAGEESQP